MADSSDSISTKSAININENKMIETLAKNNEQKWQNLGFDSDSTKRILRKNSTKPDLFNKEISDKQNKTKIRTIRSFSNIEFIMNLSNFSEEDKTFLKFGIISNKLTTNNNSNDSNSKQEKSTGNGTSNESNHSNDTSKKSSSENNTSNNSSSENDPSEISNETNTINNTENSNNETSTSNDTFCTELDHRSQIMTPNQEKRRQRKSKIPERLIPLIKCPPESPTYHALCEEPLGKIDQEKMNETLTELHQLVEEAANNGYIEEAKYVQDVEASIRCDKLTTARYSVESALEEIETKLSEAKNEYEEQMKHWENQQKLIDENWEKEKNDLNERYKKAVECLDEEWQSPNKTHSYTRPSATLMNMREMLQKSIKSQKFDDVSALSAQIEAVEKEEAMEAASRMQSDYRAADKKLHDLYKNELFAIDGNHDTKLATFQRQRLIAIKPLEQRVENLTRKKEEYLCTQKRLSTSSQFSTNSTMTPKSSLYSRNSPSSRMTPSSRCVRTARMASTSRNVPVFLNNPRLVIPNVSPIKRNNLSMTSPIKY